MISFDLLDIIQVLWSFRSSERGQALAEYSLVLGFIAMVCIIALSAIGAAVVIPFGDVVAGMGLGGGDQTPVPVAVP
jgi:Flp pilus assembly pilin Flp